MKANRASIKGLIHCPIPSLDEMELLVRLAQYSSIATLARIIPKWHIQPGNQELLAPLYSSFALDWDFCSVVQPTIITTSFGAQFCMVYSGLCFQKS